MVDQIVCEMLVQCFPVDVLELQVLKCAVVHIHPKHPEHAQCLIWCSDHCDKGLWAFTVTSPKLTCAIMLFDHDVDMPHLSDGLIILSIHLTLSLFVLKIWEKYLLCAKVSSSTRLIELVKTVSKTKIFAFSCILLPLSPAWIWRTETDKIKKYRNI